MAFDGDAAAENQRYGHPFGLADILLFPNLLAANLIVKAIMDTAACRLGGVLCGAACPVIFMRVDSLPGAVLELV